MDLKTLEKIRAEVTKKVMPESVIEECDSYGEEGYARVWYGKGKPDDPYGYGDAYHPTGSAVFCEKCFKEHGIGKEWDGEEIWKTSSTDEKWRKQRIAHITKKVEKNTDYNTALTDILHYLDTEIANIAKQP